MRMEMENLKKALEAKQVNSARRSEVLIAGKKCPGVPRDGDLKVIISVSIATHGQGSL